MKLNKHIFFSAFFLFIFISAFSSGIYTSLCDSYQAFAHFSLHKELKQDKTVSSASEDLVFEETENDSEGSVNPSLTLIPAFLSFDYFTIASNSGYAEFRHSEKITGPLFLSIRVLRI